MTEDYTRASKAILNAKAVVASTGAGISTESGIPDFRSEGGIWDTYPPDEYASIQAFTADPDKVWGMWRDLSTQLDGCKPNPGHEALAQLEAAGRLKAIITQNVDNLHQEAGSQIVVEYHGNTRHVRCMVCRKRQRLNAEMIASGTPHCECGGVFKPDVVMFGEMIPRDAMLRAEAYARSADVVLIVGTSAQVYPAAELPHTAKERGAFIIEVNLEMTDFTRSITDVFIQGKAGEALPKLAEAVLGAE